MQYEITTCDCPFHQKEREKQREAERGERIAHALKLKKKRSGLYATTWGNKTARGVFLVAQHLVNNSFGGN